MKGRLYIFGFMIIALMVASYLSFNWREGYTISKITVTGNQTLSREEILSIARLKDSAMIESETEIEIIKDRIMNHPEIKNVFVSKLPPSELKIEVTEKRPIAILNSDGELYLVDGDMETFPFRQSLKAYDMPVISGIRRINTHNPKERFNKEDLRYALFLITHSYTNSKFLYGNISEINLSDTSKAIVYLNEDASPFFMPRDVSKSISDEDYREIIQTKLKIFEEYLKQSFDNHLKSEVEYVDLRYSNHVIVNSKEGK